MNPVSDFSARIDSVFAGGGVARLERAVVPGHAGIARDASLMEHPRLMVCLEGRAVYDLKGIEGAAQVTLAPRDGLFVAPGRWVRAKPVEAYSLMGAVFYPGLTRFYLMRGRPARAGAPIRPVENHVVPEGLSEDQRALGRLLAGEAPPGADTRFLHHAFECLLMAARGVLMQTEGTVVAGGKARFTWHAACDFMQENLHRPLSRKDVARHLRVHPNHLSRLFADFGGETFSEYLQARRLERARLLLEEPRLNISEVARLSGFGSANYFTRVFRQQTGRPPTRMRGLGKMPAVLSDRSDRSD